MRSTIAKIILILCAAFCGHRTIAATSLDGVNGVLAIVDKYVITVHEVRAGMSQLARPTMSPQELQELWSNVLQGLIEEKLILTDFANSGFQIPDAYFNDAFDQMIKDRYEDRLQFVQTLKANGQHIEEVREEFKERRIIAIMSNQKINRQFAISPYKIERYYEQNKENYRIEDRVNLRMIIIPSRGSTDAVALEKAEMIRGKLLEGEDFGDLARQYSTGVYAREGGLTGWQKRDVMRREIAEAAFEMAEGETSGLITTPDAIFIIRVEEKESAHIEPLSEVRDQIEKDLESEETARRRAKWIDELRKKSFVRTF